MSQTQFRSQPSPALQSMFSETSLYLSGCQATESFPLSAWLASGSSLWRWGQNLHFKPPWLPPLLQSASHKNVMAAIEHTGPRRDLAGITRSLPNPTGQTRPVVTVWRSPRNLCVWLFYTLTPFPTSWHQPESDFNQVHILRGVMLHRGERKWQTIYKTGSGANYSKHKLFLEEDVCK